MLWIVNSIGCSLATEWFKKFSIELIFKRNLSLIYFSLIFFSVCLKSRHLNRGWNGKNLTK